MKLPRQRSTAPALKLWRRIGGASLACLLLLAAPWVVTGQAAAASNGLWSVYPTTIPGHPSRVFVEPVLTPGKTYSDAVTVVNFTAAPLTFNLYGSAAFNTPGGGLSLRRRTDPQVGIGKWLKLPVSMLTVPAHGQAVVPFTITAPKGSTAGDHVGGIVAEETTGTTATEGAIPVTVIQAVAVRVYARVRGPLHPRLSVRNMSMVVHRPSSSAFGGTVNARVRFTVTNSGNVVLTPHGLLTLNTPFDNAATRSIVIGQLLPGNTLSYSIGLSGLTAFGHLHAEITATAGKVKAQGSAAAWALPWGLLALLALVLAAWAWWLKLRRRRKEHRPRHQRPRHSSKEPALS